MEQFVHGGDGQVRQPLQGQSQPRRNDQKRAFRMSYGVKLTSVDIGAPQLGLTAIDARLGTLRPWEALLVMTQLMTDVEEAARGTRFRSAQTSKLLHDLLGPKLAQRAEPLVGQNTILMTSDTIAQLAVRLLTLKPLPVSMRTVTPKMATRYRLTLGRLALALADHKAPDEDFESAAPERRLVESGLTMHWTSHWHAKLPIGYSAHLAKELLAEVIALDRHPAFDEAQQCLVDRYGITVARMFDMSNAVALWLSGDPYADYREALIRYSMAERDAWTALHSQTVEELHERASMDIKVPYGRAASAVTARPLLTFPDGVIRSGPCARTR